MEIEQLWDLIDAHVTPCQTKLTPLMETLGLVVAQAVYSKVDLPCFDQSSMDGYALAERTLEFWRIVKEIPAGTTADVVLQPGEAARIFTGGKVPRGVTAVARQEDCEIEDDRVRLMTNIRLAPLENIRAQGGVVLAGQQLLSAGGLITPGTIALLSSCGVTELSVISKPTCLHIATGSELVEEGLSLQRGQIYDSNGPMMEALLRQANVLTNRVLVRDSLALLVEAVKNFTGNLLLISGGSGPGDHDHTADALNAAGYAIHGSQINSRPGKPLIFATRGYQLAFGLPGNPLSHWVCYHAFVVRALARLQGLRRPEFIHVPLTHPINKRSDERRTWTPARVFINDDGWSAEPLPWKHSGDMTPLLRANALILDGDPRKVMVLSHDI